MKCNDNENDISIILTWVHLLELSRSNLDIEMHKFNRIGKCSSLLPAIEIQPAELVFLIVVVVCVCGSMSKAIRLMVCRGAFAFDRMKNVIMAFTTDSLQRVFSFEKCSVRVAVVVIHLSVFSFRSFVCVLKRVFWSLPSTAVVFSPLIFFIYALLHIFFGYSHHTLQYKRAPLKMRDVEEAHSGMENKKREKKTVGIVVVRLIQKKHKSARN